MAGAETTKHGKTTKKMKSVKSPALSHESALGKHLEEARCRQFDGRAWSLSFRQNERLKGRPPLSLTTG